MVRKYAKKKRVYRKKRPLIRRIPRPMRLPSFYNFKRVVTLLNGVNRWFSVTNTPYDTLSNYSLSFNLQQLASYTEFTNLFDQYKIYKVVLDIRPYCATQNVTVNNTTNNVAYPYVHCVIDHDDDTLLTAVSDYQQYSSYRRFPVGRPMKISIIPRVSTAVYQSALSTGYSAKRAWIDSENSLVPHYGFKFGINGAGLGITSSYAIDIEATFYIGCRGVR